jgi:amino acid permease
MTMAVINDSAPAISHSPSINSKDKDNVGQEGVKINQHDGEVVQSASGTYDAVYGVGGVGRTQRALKARHITFIGFGGGIGTGLFIGTGAALAKAGPLGLLL